MILNKDGGRTKVIVAQLFYYFILFYFLLKHGFIDERDKKYMRGIYTLFSGGTLVGPQFLS